MKRVIGVCAVVMLGVATIPTVASAASSSLPPASVPAFPDKTQNVIVVLRDQHTGVQATKGHNSPRARANRNDEAHVESKASAAGARNVRGFDSVNAVAATLTKPEAEQLAIDPSVAAIVPDLPIQQAPTVAAAERANSSAAPVGPVGPTDLCPSDPAHPLVEPEALGLTNTAFDNHATPQAQNLVSGAGVKVAWIADGVDVNNPDFIRPDGNHVFVDYQDFSGDGLDATTGAAEAFGDASAIAAQGRQVYDLSDYVNPAHPLPPGCNITVRGVAPGASLIGLKVFGNAPTAPTSRFIEAIDYTVAAGSDVLNESFGGNPYPDTSDDPITLADNAAIAAGVTVVASTGDAGTNGTIGSPSSSPSGIIGVGATTSFQSYLQETGNGAQFSNGHWASNNISSLSSGGVTESSGVPDLVAPGDLGWALCTPNPALYTECVDDKGAPSGIQNFGGTSQSSPLTSGAAALVIQAYEQTHHGVRPAPALVKQILTSTATDLSHPASEQGAGLLNSLAAVQAAESWHDANGSPAIVGNSLVVNPTQIRASGNPRATLSNTISVTNMSNQTQTVRGTTRSFEKTVKTTNASTSLNTATASTFIDKQGISRSFVTQHFTVDPNIDRLDVSAAFSPSPFAGRIILLDPSGVYTAYSIPQGASNFGHVDVRFPAGGTWTAIFGFSTASGYNGPIQYTVTETDMTTHGTVRPASQVLAPGASAAFTVVSRLPETPSDLSTSAQFVGSHGAATSVPVTLRADVPPDGFTWNAPVTGGNGRSTPGVGQSNIYYVNVVHGKRDLSIGLTFDDPGPLVLATLRAPDGQVYSFQSNGADKHALQMYRRDPMPGQWVLSVDTTNPASGAAVTHTMTAKVAYNTVQIKAPKLPNNPQMKLKAGVPVDVPVTIKNTGVAPLTYFADPRLTTQGTLVLTELSGTSTFPLPQPPGVNPFWLVPTETNSLTENTTADQPVNADLFFESGNPDAYSSAVGNGASVTVHADQVSPGIWITDLGQSGPFNGPAPTGTANVSAIAHGQLFDLSMNSSTGDEWAAGVEAQGPDVAPAIAARVRATGRSLANGTSSSASPAATPDVSPGPVTLNPGQSTTITLTITPGAPSGTVVSGNVYIDTFDFNVTDSGDELIALPYAYVVK